MELTGAAITNEVAFSNPSEALEGILERFSPVLAPAPDSPCPRGLTAFTVGVGRESFMHTFPDSSDLVQALRSGDAAAWSSLQATVRDAVLSRIPRAEGLDREEVLTDVTTTLWLSLKSLRDSSKLLAFTATIARRVVAGKLKSRRRHVPLTSDPPAWSEEPASRNLESQELLHRMVGSLEGADKALFKLLYVAGASSEEVQKTLSVSPGIFRQRKHRMHRRMQKAAGCSLAPVSGGAGRST